MESSLLDDLLRYSDEEFDEDGSPPPLTSRVTAGEAKAAAGRVVRTTSATIRTARPTAGIRSTGARLAGIRPEPRRPLRITRWGPPLAAPAPTPTLRPAWRPASWGLPQNPTSQDGPTPQAQLQQLQAAVRALTLETHLALQRLRNEEAALRRERSQHHASTTR